MSSIDGSANEGSINGYEQPVPSSADGTLTPPGEDHSLVPRDSNATTTQVPNISQVTRFPRISAVGDLYPDDTYIRHFREHEDRVTKIRVPKRRYTTASVEMVPCENSEDGYDPDASYLEVNGEDGPQRRTFRELEIYEMGLSTTVNNSGYMAIGPEMRIHSDWAPNEVFLFGEQEVDCDEDDQDKYITIKKYQRGYYRRRH